MKNKLVAATKTAGRAARAVIHDPEVQRTGKQLAAKIGARVALAVPGLAFYITLVVKGLGQ